MKSFLLLIILVIALAGCNETKKITSGSKDTSLAAFQQLMVGNYNSAKQAKSDTNYYNISLVMVPIWASRTDGKWLYVEQAMATKLDKPYRQRVYHLQHPSSNIFTSDIYTIKDAMAFAGAQSDLAKINLLTFDKIELKEGCTVSSIKKWVNM